MPLGWPTPVVWPWLNQLATLSPASTSSRLGPSTLILIRSSTVSEWRDALVQWFSNFFGRHPPPPPPPTLYKNPAPPSHLWLPNNFTKHYEKKRYLWITKPVCLSVLILYFNCSQILNKTVLLYIFYCFFYQSMGKIWKSDWNIPLRIHNQLHLPRS